MSHTSGGEIDLYFEAAAVITVPVFLGQVLEFRARSKMSRALKAPLFRQTNAVS